MTDEAGNNIANEFYPYMNYHGNSYTSRIALFDIMEQIYESSLTAESPRTPAPPQIKIPLKPHQEALLYEMEARETRLRAGHVCADATTLYSRYAVLGDAVGAGKSLTVLAYIARMKGRPLEQPPYIHKASTTKLYSLWNPPQYNRTANLIIVPHTIFRQWDSYIKTQTNLKAVLCKNRAFFTENVTESVREILESDVVLVTNTMYNELQVFAQAHSIHWARIFVDEVDTVHLPDRHSQLCADFVWLITASWMQTVILPNIYITTYMIDRYIENGDIDLDAAHPDFKQMIVDIQNSHSTTSVFNSSWKSIRFFSPFISTHPNRHYLVVRSSNAFRDESLALPRYANHVIRCRSTLQHRLVDTLITPHIQSMLHAGDVSGALQELGVPEAEEMSLVDAVMNNQKKELQRLEATLAFKQGLDYATPAAKAAALAHLETKIESLKVQIASFEDRVKAIDATTCSICMDTPVAPVCVPCCKHIMCGACILQWFTMHTACPMCRTPLKVKDLRQIVKEKSVGRAAAAAADGASQLLRKSEALLKVISENASNGRFIVFSRHDNPFDSIAQQLHELGITVEQVRGNKDAVYATMNRFRDGSTRVLLLNITYFAAGLNLDAATHVILYHGNISGDERQQIIGRAQRLGRTAPLTVIQLLHENE